MVIREIVKYLVWTFKRLDCTIEFKSANRLLQLRNDDKKKNIFVILNPSIICDLDNNMRLL